MVIVELGLRQKIEQMIDECRKVSQQHCLDEPFNMPSVIWHETQGQIQAYQKVLALVDEDARLRQEQLRKLLDEFPSIHQNSALRRNSVVRCLIEDYEEWKKKAEKELFERGV